MKNYKALLVGFLLFFLLPNFANSQTVADTNKSWKYGGVTSLMITQVAMSNWAAGGQNSISGTAMVSVFANYHKNLSQWDNTLDLNYGMMKQGKAGIIKSDDKIDFSSKFGQYAFKHWYYSALLNFKSQFGQGYNYPNDSVMISDFMAPGYLTVALGMDYKPADYFTLLIAPVTGRMTFVNNQTLADQGACGVDPATYDSLGNVVTNGKKVRFEFGGYIKAAFNYNIMKNINLQAKVDLFTNYLKKPQNIDVNGELLLSLKVNKFISASISANIIYDDDVKIGIDDNKDGVVDRTGPRTQIKEVLGVGFSYTF
jgi:hypothetical protein